MNESPKSRDLIASPAGLILHWGLPIAAMLAAIGVSHPAKTWIWVTALGWMGGACLWNARRCGRKHYFWTGPFFLVMTLPVIAHGYGFAAPGAEGWKWLGMSIGFGSVILTTLTERNGKLNRPGFTGGQSSESFALR